LRQLTALLADLLIYLSDLLIDLSDILIYLINCRCGLLGKIARYINDELGTSFCIHGNRAIGAAWYDCRIRNYRPLIRIQCGDNWLFLPSWPNC